MNTRTVVSHGVALLILCFLIEAIWGASAGVLAGKAIASDPAYQKELEAFLKQKGIDTNSPSEVNGALAKLSAEDKAALQRMTADLMKRHQIGGFRMTLFVSLAAFGIAGLIAGYFSRMWQWAWVLVAASFLLNNPLRRFAMLADMPRSQMAVVVAAQLGVTLLAAFLAARLALSRRAPETPTPLPTAVPTGAP